MDYPYPYRACKVYLNRCMCKIDTRRPPGSVARYRMLKHELRQENPDLAAMVQKTRRRQLEHEGVATVRYTLQALTPLPLYTKIEVTLPPPPAKVSSAAGELNLYNM